MKVTTTNVTPRKEENTPAGNPVPPPPTRGTHLPTNKPQHSQETGSHCLSNLKIPLRLAHNLMFGEKIAHGMLVSFGAGNAQIHIKDTELKPILESIRTYGDSITNCITKYQGISGTTPSKSGFRVFSLVLRKLIPADTVGYSHLKSVCEDALSIDLMSPQDPSWKREVILPINGAPTKITVSIAPQPLSTRAILKTVKTDVPAEYKNNRYAYRLTMEPAQFTEGSFIRKTKALFRQAMTAATLSGPIIMAGYILGQGALSTIIPRITSDPHIQKGLLGVSNLSILGAVGTATYLAYERYNTSRLLKK